MLWCGDKIHKDRVSLEHARNDERNRLTGAGQHPGSKIRQRPNRTTCQGTLAGHGHPCGWDSPGRTRHAGTGNYAG